jgi:TrmH family RNA methyltransferase
MPDTDIASMDNPRIKALRKLARRRERAGSGLALIEGVRLVGEAVEAGVVEEVFYAPSLLDGPAGVALLERIGAFVPSVSVPSAHGPSAPPAVFSVTEPVLASCADTETPQGIVATVRIRVRGLSEFLGELALPCPRRTAAASVAPLLLVLDRLRDPGNAGTILRTAAAAGVAGVVALGGTVDFLSPKVLRAAMGAAFRIPLVEDDGECPRDIISRLSACGLRTLAASPRAGKPCYQADFTGPLAILVGNEATGVSPELEEAAGELVSIPMSGHAESLNVAVAAGILLYEAVRQRAALP